MSYSEKLKDVRWQCKRREILERDENKCKHCGEVEGQMHVHHTSYSRGREPWEYENDSLVTLCWACHLDLEDQREELHKALAPLTWQEMRAFHKNVTDAMEKGGVGELLTRIKRPA